MQIDGSIITEQGFTFAIIVVDSGVLSSSLEKEHMQQAGKKLFGNMPIVLMAQDSGGVPTYSGRPDIVKSLSKIKPSKIPWKKYTVNLSL